MDPFRLCVALLPLAAYLLLLGLVNMMRRPVVFSGAIDMALLAAGLTGLIVVGPMELFLPEPAVMHFGGWVWLMMLALYFLLVSFFVLLSRPRLVIYNITIEELRPILAQLVPRLDGEGRWAGDSISLPQLGIQFHLDSFAPMRNVSLVASGQQQNLSGWRQLELALRKPLVQAPVQFSPRGATLVGLALVLIALCTVQSLGHPQALAQSMKDMLRL